MIWVDVALKTVALASTIIATLRAGSRAVYLMEHDAIGIMDGPLITKSVRDINETNPLLELSEAFRHSVRLSIAPQFYENVQTAQPVFQKAAVGRPYPLSPRPYLELVEHVSKKNSDDENDDDDDDNEEIITDEELDQMVEQMVTKQELMEDKTPSFSSSVFKRLSYTRANKRILSSVTSTYQYTRKSLALTPQFASNLMSSLPSTYQYTRNYLAVTPQLASYWAQRVWYWKRWKDEEKSDLEDGAEESGKQSEKRTPQQ
jgi:hypothetical protein